MVTKAYSLLVWSFVNSVINMDYQGSRQVVGNYWARRVRLQLTIRWVPGCDSLHTPRRVYEASPNSPMVVVSSEVNTDTGVFYI